MSVRCSLCMIVKNEAAVLPACLDSVRDLVAEMIVADTGSSDQTRQIAAERGACVLDFAWCDDFAAARNASLAHATGDWVFWLDADESLDEANRQKLQALLNALPEGPGGNSMKQRSRSGPGTSATVVDQVRLFRRDPGVNWEYRVHEQLLPSLRRAGHPVYAADIVIEHAGYEDPVYTRRKLRRNLRLLDLDARDRPDDPFMLFNLGWALLELGRDAEAVPLLRRSLERSQPGDSIVPKLFALLVHAARRAGRPAQALALCEAGRVHHPDNAELAFLEAGPLKQQGDLVGAERAWQRLVDRDHTPAETAVGFSSAVEGLGKRHARHELAVLCQEQGRAEEARRHWRAILADAPAFLPAWRGLGELYLTHQRWNELDAVIAELANGFHRPEDAALLQARARLTQRDFNGARVLLEEHILRDPAAVPPRVYLSHLCLREAQAAADPRSPLWDAAERTLRAVVRMDPAEACSWRNLTLLLWQERRQPAEALAACRAGRFHCPTDPALRLLEEQIRRATGLEQAVAREQASGAA